jgi:hypothetical protein
MNLLKLTALLVFAMVSTAGYSESFECTAFCLKIKKQTDGFTQHSTMKAENAERVVITVDSPKNFSEIMSRLDKACGDQRIVSAYPSLSVNGMTLDYGFRMRQLCRKRLDVPVREAATEIPDATS